MHLLRHDASMFNMFKITYPSRSNRGRSLSNIDSGTHGRGYGHISDVAVRVQNPRSQGREFAAASVHRRRVVPSSRVDPSRKARQGASVSFQTRRWAPEVAPE